MTVSGTGIPTPVLDDMEKLEANITYLTDQVIHGSLVHQFVQFDDDGQAMQQLQDGLVALIIGKFGYPDEAIALPHP